MAFFSGLWKLGSRTLLPSSVLESLLISIFFALSEFSSTGSVWSLTFKSSVILALSSLSTAFTIEESGLGVESLSVSSLRAISVLLTILDWSMLSLLAACIASARENEGLWPSEEAEGVFSTEALRSWF